MLLDGQDELAVLLRFEFGNVLTGILAAVFLLASMVFVYRSFYGMRIDERMEDMTIEGRAAEPTELVTAS